jgi:hypothetical protein
MFLFRIQGRVSEKKKNFLFICSTSSRLFSLRRNKGKMLASPAPTTCPFSNRTTVQLPRSILPNSRRSSFVPSQSHLTNTALTTAPPELEIPLIYLPPLLSLLPIDVERDPTHSPAETSLSFDFDSPSVGFTTSRLPSIDVASIALHYALYKFRPTGKDYASVSYFDAFNWDELRLPIDVEREWYVMFPNSSAVRQNERILVKRKEL